MLINPLGKKVLNLAIPVNISSQLNQTELKKLVKSYNLCEQAMKDFLSAKLTWEEYLNILELHQVNIDSYLKTVDCNLHNIGIN